MEHATNDDNASARRRWTQDRLDRLVAMWGERRSAQDIARVLGGGISRSAVVGKLFRLGLRRSDEERHDAQVRGARRGARRRRGPPVLPLAPLPAATPVKVSPRLAPLEQLQARDCRWPYDTEAGLRFCGCPARQKGPYCREHRRVAYGAVLPPLTLESLEIRER